jgi:CheY-like chemotaxis protein
VPATRQWSNWVGLAPQHGRGQQLCAKPSSSRDTVDSEGCRLLAQTVAARMGGYIECSSEVDIGSTFTIKLPCQPTNLVVSTSYKKTAGDELFHMSPALARLHASGTRLSQHKSSMDQVGLDKTASNGDPDVSNSRPAADDDDGWHATPSRSTSQTEAYSRNKSATLAVVPSRNASASSTGTVRRSFEVMPSRNTSANSTGTVRRSFEVAKVMTTVTPPKEEPPPKKEEPRPLHVLLIDDQEFNLRLLSTCLERLNYKVSKDSKVLDALQLLTTAGDITLEDRLDVVMVDEMMPAMNGSEMTQRLRAFELANGLPHLPVICVTANTSPDDRIRYVFPFPAASSVAPPRRGPARANFLRGSTSDVSVLSAVPVVLLLAPGFLSAGRSSTALAQMPCPLDVRHRTLWQHTLL